MAFISAFILIVLLFVAGLPGSAHKDVVTSGPVSKVVAVDAVKASGRSYEALARPTPPPSAERTSSKPLRDEMLEGLVVDEAGLPPTISHGGLHETVRSERRDPDWAPRAEEALRSELANVRYLDANSVPRIICGATLCELAVPLSSAASNDQANEALARLQSSELAAKANVGLDPTYNSVAVGPTLRQPRVTMFVRYFSRLP